MRSLQKHLISLLLYIHHNVCSSVAHWLIITLSLFLYFGRVSVPGISVR